MEAYGEDHSEMEYTQRSPEISWNNSIWPINVPHNHNIGLNNFQYKLKNETLVTPARRYFEQTVSKKIPVPENELCPVCKHPTQKADTAHIFGNCIVASEHNLKLWTTLKNQHSELQSTPCWFIVSENNNNNNNNNNSGQTDFKAANWDAHLGNIGYIPTRIANKLDKEQQIKMAQTIAESRHELWKDY